ncbi:MAG TPA: DNA polymerase III subunit delta [Sediminispirochaeta sp.]|nr:DNA polymerase III subunit delta [Sediminispirochaeta sp.]
MKKPAPVYLLVGPEEGEKREFVEQILQSYQDQSSEEAENHRFYAGQTPVSEVVSLLRNGALFSSYKFVQIYNIEELKKPEQQELAEYLTKPDPSATIFLLTSEYRSPAAINKKVPKAQRKTFFELFENKKRQWLLSYFRRAEIDIEDEAVEMLLDLVENNTLEMKNAADKLILYYGAGRRLNADDIEVFIYHSKEENVFSLFHRISRRDLPGALEVLHKITLSGQSNGVQIFGGLLWQFRRLLKLSRMLERNFAPDEAFRSIPLLGKRNQNNYMEACRNFSTADIEKIIALIADFDGRAREQRGEVEALLLDYFIYTILHKKSRPQRRLLGTLAK